MTNSLGKTILVGITLVLSLVLVILVVTEDEPGPKIIDTTLLSKSGIKDLNVEYAENKIYLNVDLITPQSCTELIKTLGIHPIVIKSKIYQPVCSRVSEFQMRITYTLTVTA